MKISGYGEFQQMRKLIQKEDLRGRSASSPSGQEVQSGGNDADAVQISGEARRKIKLLQTPEIREAKMADVKERMDAGTLVTPEALRNGAERMLKNMISGELGDF